MAKKATPLEKFYAFLSPDVAVNKDGYLVSADSWWDGGQNSTDYLSDTSVDAFNRYYSLSDVGDYATEADRQNALYSVLDNNRINVIDSYSALDSNPFWKSLSPEQKSDYIRAYGVDASPELLKKHLDELASIGSAPIAPTFNYDPAKIESDVDAYLAQPYADARNRLNSEEAMLTKSYEDQLQTSTDMYNRQASGLLSNQYLANAQTYDALQSDMRKARQNALESGASAGIRLAGNVNALLTAQNKQSQTAMDTSNALAEMLLQQRNAAAGIRSDYRGYMSDLNQRRTNLDAQQRSERQGLINDKTDQAYRQYEADTTNYNNALTNWENKGNSVDPSNNFTSGYLTYVRNQS